MGQGHLQWLKPAANKDDIHFLYGLIVPALQIPDTGKAKDLRDVVLNHILVTFSGSLMSKISFSQP